MLSYAFSVKIISKNVKYKLTYVTDSIADFLKNNRKSIIVFCLLLIVGLVVGIISAIKPIDAEEAFLGHNSAVYKFIENAAYLPYVFICLFTFLAIMVVSSFFGRYKYSIFFLDILTAVFGYFQGGTIIFVVRIYGAMAIPFAVAYTLGTLLCDLIFVSFFSLLKRYVTEYKKYGCRTSFINALYSCLPFVFLMLFVFALRYLVLILTAFYL